MDETVRAFTDSRVEALDSAYGELARGLRQVHMLLRIRVERGWSREELCAYLEASAALEMARSRWISIRSEIVTA
jgi:hypothetical protein